MNFKDVATYGGGGLLLLMTLLQISPIKINPWSWLAKAIGRAINSDLMNQVKGLSEDLKALKSADEEREARDWRRSILQFGDELYMDEHHTRERFDQILEDITDYERYCRDHPDFKNEKTVSTVRHIKAVYDRCLDSRSFLE